MAIIKRTRSLQGVGILANRSARDVGPEFLRYNLIYGFNGSGKSTLSRLFACLERGKLHEDMPDGCAFEVEMDDGTVYRSPDSLGGLEERVCVFNTDFIDRSLQWKSGRAASIFYISEEQAGAAAELHEKQTALQGCRNAATAQQAVVDASSRALAAHKTERARTISNALHLGRRYEAPQLQIDYDNLRVEEGDVLADDALNDLQDVARQADPPSPLQQLPDVSSNSMEVIEAARGLAELSIAQIALEEVERHPAMVPWLKTGHEYHTAHGLECCLLCANPLTEDRKVKLAAALDDRLSQLLDDLRTTREAARLAASRLASRESWPNVNELEGSLRTPFNSAKGELEAAAKPLEINTQEAERAMLERLERPTLPVAHKLPTSADVRVAVEVFRLKLSAVNKVIARHNAAAADFATSQSAAREKIRKHFVAQSISDYAALKAETDKAQANAAQTAADVGQLERDIADLTARVRTHGPAANQITQLVRAYLGHGELTIIAADDEGYELHRHGKLVKGPPSEGEKTAIALCYFLSTLAADGRNIKDLIVVVDDPISSLDTKALNYASTLIRARLDSAAQVFVLTHNQHCMNEFKKGWKSRAKPPGDKPPTAALLFVDVSMPEGSDRREARIIELPGHLKGYDSEYHFLCSKALEFEAVGSGYSEYWFMMPNVIRRVLDVFLGFKEPGSHPLTQKLDNLAKKLPNLDAVRVKALDRLIQVESHSDSLDDLIAHSSMTVEETRDANDALLALMAEADDAHTAAIRHQCKP